MKASTPPVQVLLPDGVLAWARRLRPGDVTAVMALRSRLTGHDHSFALGATRLTELATQLTHSSGIGHTAVGCFVHSRLIGVARYDVLADPAMAEVALVVDDRVPALGVSTILLEQLVVAASADGVRSFLADVRAEDPAALGVFTALGLPFHLEHDRPATVSLVPA
ncbi:GNAT family N-acetyltransferase [Amycolatopsis sp. NBC_00345]|uniref:GNAT family N-acetyltransferase n=1 Tax=Amycolatopsis sp. NBC_00345 TaxID=2975955 RepID=UPI002E2692AE